MKHSTALDSNRTEALVHALRYPQLRFMGSKYKLIPWIYSVFDQLEFENALDAFSGSGCVSYLLKCMGKSVTSNDFLNFSYHFANALISNNHEILSDEEIKSLVRKNRRRKHFIRDNFTGIFFTEEENDFLDNIWSNIGEIESSYKRSLVIASLCRACVKKQPRGVFSTVTANNQKYDDGRNDLKQTLNEHFVHSSHLLNELVFDNERKNHAVHGDIYALDNRGYDLVYFDPPYVPLSDDNCYIKRYHFLEGLSCYWEGLEIMESSVVRKIKKKYTPFSYRGSSIDAFRQLFDEHRDSIIVLSYSSNGYPDKDTLIRLLEEVKGRDNVQVEEENHTYHFGSHSGVSMERKRVKEYLFIGA